VLAHGASRSRIAHVLNIAYADGLLSDETFADRLDQLFRARVVDPSRLIGDLTTRGAGRWTARLTGVLRRLY
jgi:SOS response regulatory protein OraA/RecX